MGNVENAISEPLDFKMFWRSMPSDPYKPCAFVTHFQVPHLKIRSAVPHSGVQDSPLCVSIPMG